MPALARSYRSSVLLVPEGMLHLLREDALVSGWRGAVKAYEDSSRRSRGALLINGPPAPRQSLDSRPPPISEIFKRSLFLRVFSVVIILDSLACHEFPSFSLSSVFSHPSWS